MNMIKKISNKLNGRNYRKLAVKLSLIACTIAFAMCNACMFAFADNAENAKPTNAGGSSAICFSRYRRSFRYPSEENRDQENHQR